MGVTSGSLPEGCVIANLCGCVILTGCGHMASDINAQVLLVAGELIQEQKHKSHNGCGGNTNVIISIQQDSVQCCVSFPLSNCCSMYWVVCWKPPWPLQPRQDISAELRPIPWPSFRAAHEATARWWGSSLLMLPTWLLSTWCYSGYQSEVLGILLSIPSFIFAIWLSSNQHDAHYSHRNLMACMTLIRLICFCNMMIPEMQYDSYLVLSLYIFGYHSNSQVVVPVLIVCISVLYKLSGDCLLFSNTWIVQQRNHLISLAALLDLGTLMTLNCPADSVMVLLMYYSEPSTYIPYGAIVMVLQWLEWNKKHGHAPIADQKVEKARSMKVIKSSASASMQIGKIDVDNRGQKPYIVKDEKTISTSSQAQSACISLRASRFLRREECQQLHGWSTGSVCG